MKLHPGSTLYRLELVLNSLVSSLLIPKTSVATRMYGLLKVHKVGCPLRPIVNTIGLHTLYAMSQFLAGLLKPYIRKTSTYVKNSAALVDTLDGLILAPTDIMLILDVVSLYTRYFYSFGQLGSRSAQAIPTQCSGSPPQQLR